MSSLTKRMNHNSSNKQIPKVTHIPTKLSPMQTAEKLSLSLSASTNSHMYTHKLLRFILTDGPHANVSTLIGGHEQITFHEGANNDDSTG